MKKTLATIAILISSLSTQAQHWEIAKTEADELLGIKETLNYVYTDSTFSFLLEPNKYMQLTVANATFDTTWGGTHHGEIVRFGLYDENNTLIETYDLWLDKQRHNVLSTRQAGTMNPTGQNRKVKKITKHLSNGKGYIRIFAPLYEKNSLDIIIPNINN